MVRILGHYIRAPVVALAAMEVLVLVFAHYLGVFLRFADIYNFWGELVAYFWDAVIFVSAVWLSMYAFGLYQAESFTDRQVMLLRLSVSFLVGCVAIAALQYSFKGLTIWRSTLLIAIVAGMVGIVGVRQLWSPILNSPAFRRRVLVLGTGIRAARIEALERAQISKSFVCVGCVPVNDGRTEVSPDLVLRAKEPLARLVERFQVDEIVVAVEDRRKEVPLGELLDVKMSGVAVYDFSTFWERRTGLIDLDNVYPSSFIFSDGFGGNRIQRDIKRLFDLVVSIIFLIITLPVLVAVALAIKLDSPGPVLYRQERVGLHGKPFMLLKFRSMIVDAEDDGVPRWSPTDDKRLTRVGSVIRRTRIDEIPQIFNVLAGDMSLVGPRPERPHFVSNLTQKIPYYSERHRVKPGISGWAQINFPYGASVQDAKQKLQYDLYYIKNYTFMLDFIILLQTARVVLWPEQAR